MIPEILCLALALGQDPELRGAWLMHDTFDTPSRRVDILAKCKKAHLNTIFPTAAPIGANYGEATPAAFTALLDDAKAAGLQVHVWIQNYKRLGGETNPVDFRDPTERETQKQWALSLLAAYPKLDGVHFDYIRYPTWEDSDAAKISGVAETVRITKEAMKTQYPGKTLTAAVFRAAAVSYRGQNSTWNGAVPQWYRDWYAAYPNNWFATQAQTQPGLQSNWLLGPSYMSYQQDPPAWLKGAYLDGCMSMQYTAADQVWQDEVAIWKSFLSYLGGSTSTIYMGLGWMGPSQWWTDSAFDPAAMVRFVKHGRSQGIKGFVIFRLGQPGVDDNPLLDALSADVFKTDVASTLGAAAPPAPPPPGGAAPKPKGGGGGGPACGLTGLEVFFLLGLLRRR